MTEVSTLNGKDEEAHHAPSGRLLTLVVGSIYQ